jgi:hypothetical protein
MLQSMRHAHVAAILETMQGPWGLRGSPLIAVKTCKVVVIDV